MGVLLEQHGVARWYNNPEKGLKHANAQREQKQGLDVPLGIEGVARQPKHLTMACHLKAGVWHASYWNQGKIMGVARWYKFPERMKEANYMGRATWYRRCGTPLTILHLGVPLESQALHASVIQRAKKHWGVPLEFMAWHAKQRNHLLTKGRGTPDSGRATLVQLSREA
ncbi:hypothetical protein AHAS_Ahas18G0207200 [Arachis hypogaea]